MPFCPKCSALLTCVACAPEKAVGEDAAVLPCAVKKGSLWIQVNSDTGQGVEGVRVSADGAVKSTDAGGFAAWDPLPAKVYQAKVEALEGQVKEAYHPPEKDSADATVKDGEIAFVPFVLKRNAELTWVEIEMIGEDNSPVAGVGYRVVLANGEIHEGSLDSLGRARIDKIPPAGNCEVTFPELDRDAWAKV